MLSAREIRNRLRFDVERLRDAAWRLEHIDRALTTLRHHLQARAQRLARDAAGRTRDDGNGLRFAQAQATAILAKKAALKEILRVSGLPLIVSMAVGRWMMALAELNAEPRGERRVRAQIEAGRLAYQMLVTLRRKRGLRSGLGQLTAAVVVAESVHAADLGAVHEQIEEGLFRRQSAARVHSEEDALAGASLALREAAYLLERMAGDAEPALARLLEEADDVEAQVERVLGKL
ncbi:MAG: hypothetical protein IT384_33555 [Deltaproteobacteria bacterium]|nr:hypothetical protein [Deltaproteobacteria bacterium]